jgi:cell division protein FtsL
MSKSKKMSKVLSVVKKCNTVFVISIVAFWMVALVANNYSNSQTLNRTQLDKDIRVYEDDIRLLSARVSELKTTERIENESKKLDLVRVQTQDIFYLDTTDDKVALK